MSTVRKPAKPKGASPVRARRPVQKKRNAKSKPRKATVRSKGSLVTAIARALGTAKPHKPRPKGATRPKPPKRAAAKGATRRSAAVSPSRRPAARAGSAAKRGGRPKSTLRKSGGSASSRATKPRPPAKRAKGGSRLSGAGAAAVRRPRSGGPSRGPAASRRSASAAGQGSRRLPARAAAGQGSRRPPARAAAGQGSRRPPARAAVKRSLSKSGGASHATKSPAVRVPFRAYSGTKPYIFVSYAHHNMSEVFPILRRLDESRFRMWYDEGIEPGNEWPEVVGKAVLGCSQLLVFMSRAAARSRNVRNEVNLAFSSGKNIVVVYLEKTSLSEGMRLQVGSVQSLNWYEIPREEFLDRIKKVLQSVAPTKG